MSAYGTISNPSSSIAPLASTVWSISPKADTARRCTYITLHHFRLDTVRLFPELLKHLHVSFADELARGITYPQELAPGEEYGIQSFEAYFFSSDVFVAIAGEGSSEIGNGGSTSISADAARNGRTWEQCVAGFYYVKPNYPGRSSHICNAGFVVPYKQRALGFGGALARSYVHTAPRLGYEASVFNLVYVNNIASIKLWESLNFTKAGRIPRAGRLRKADGQGEEFVDAWIFYKRFETEDTAV